MRDPHVVSVRYRLETTEDLSFEDPPPIEWGTDAFRMRLEDDILDFEMKEHFASAEDAREAVEDFVRAWEIDVALRYGRRQIQFVFENAEVIDRNPPPPRSPQTVRASTLLSEVRALSVTATVTRREYPEPAKQFRAFPDVETLWQRYEDYLDGREKLLQMAFACQSKIEENAGGRRQAAKKYRIDKDVLDKLGYFTSARGDERTARKFHPRYSTYKPLTSAEVAWVESAVKVIIRRVGELGSASSLPVITMSNLPKI